MDGDAERDGVLKSRTRRAVGSVKTRIESLVQPVPGHELADVRFERRTAIGPRSARALTIIVAAVAVVLGGGMLIGLLTGGGGDGGTVAVEGLSPTGAGQLTGYPLVTDDPSAGRPEIPVDNGAGAGGGDGETVVIAVQGLVDRPGLLTVDEGTRLGEVLDLVGGARPEAGLEGINLAEKVVDGLQVVVDAEGSRVTYPGQAVQAGGASAGAAPAGTAPGGASAGAAGATVNINTADLAGLVTLAGVGEKTAQAIIAWREANGPFTSTEQLMEVKGIGPAKYEALRDAVSV
ncbi:ComEA family DNA-binding protein [uncultured Corynebacterium sp.]|uniref:ComEA family DNA-binding protein n=1 Tax=uncultured Corynebacterium sp. TaxID=159447 RepID=UPI0025DEA923|nr:ComEA family DNA-binding protein [uncultured Corynebacterium sp.]